MKEILKFWYGPFYTDLISFLVALAGLIISIWKRAKNRKLNPLIFFFLAYILDLLFARIIFQDKVLFIQYNYLGTYADFFDTIIEFFAFFFLIKNHIVNIRIKKNLNSLLPIFLSLVILYFIYYRITRVKIDQYFLQNIFTIQALFLSIACVLYYIDLYKKESKLNLTVLPSFWAITGLSFFMVCTLPYSILGSYLMQTDFRSYFQLFSIFNIFYCILFLMIMKAYFCRPQQSSWQ